MSRFGVGGFSPSWGAGFTGNPFQTLSDVEWEAVAILPNIVRDAIDHPDMPHVQILGDKGRGKSSVLKAMRREANRHNKFLLYEYIPAGTQAVLSNVPTGWWFCLDEAQRLNPWQREKLIQTAQDRNHRLILATHEDLTPLFQQTNQAVVAVTLDQLDEQHFVTVLETRIAYFSRANVPVATLDISAYDRLRAQFGTDLRSAERFLYRYFQENVHGPAIITADKLSF